MRPTSEGSHGLGIYPQVTRRDAPESGRGSERVTSDQPDAQDWAEAFRLEMAHRYRALAILYLYLGNGGSER